MLSRIQLEKDLKELDEEISKKEKEMKELMEKISDNEKQRNDLERRIQEKEQEIQSLKKKKDQKDELKPLEGILKKLLSEKKNLEKQIEKDMNRKKNMEKEIKKLHSRRRQLSEDLHKKEKTSTVEDQGNDSLSRFLIGPIKSKIPKKRDTTNTKTLIRWEKIDLKIPKEDLPLVGVLYRSGNKRFLAIKYYSEIDEAKKEAKRFKSRLVVA